MTIAKATQAQQLELIASFLNVSKAQNLELAAFKAKEVSYKEAIRKATLAHFMTDEQAAAIVKASADISDTNFATIVAAYASNAIKPVEKSVEIEIVKPKTSADITFELLQAKYGKK